MVQNVASRIVGIAKEGEGRICSYSVTQGIQPTLRIIPIGRGYPIWIGDTGEPATAKEEEGVGRNGTERRVEKYYEASDLTPCSSTTRRGGPVGRTRRVFETVSQLPRNQQQKILDVVDALVAQTSQRSVS